MADWAAVAIAAVALVVALMEFLQAVATTRLESDPSRARFDFKVSGAQPSSDGTSHTRVVLTCVGPTVRVVQFRAYSEDWEEIKAAPIMDVPVVLTCGSRRLIVVPVPTSTATFQLAATYELDLPWPVSWLNRDREGFAWSRPLVAAP